MQAGIAQIGIDEQRAPSMLPHQDLGEIGRYERLAFLGQRTRHQQPLQWHLLADLIKPGTQRAELFRAQPAVVLFEEQHGFLVRTPRALRAACDQRFVIQRGAHIQP